MLQSLPVTIATVLIMASLILAQDVSDRRKEELQGLRQMLPKSEPFEQWLTQTGELPPDFDALPTRPWPPDIFTTLRDGKPGRVTLEQWPQRRAEMRKLLEDWIVGHAPPQQQDVRAVIEDKMHEEGFDIWQVRLEFGPGHAARLHCWLFMSPAMKKPAPVFLVDNFKYTSFAHDALVKGTFAVCVYNASDPVYFPFMPKYVKDRVDESDGFKDSFGKYDWCEFYRRGWSASRALDWLATLDFVDAKHIYIGGHSRSAKQAMTGAAFDDRIAGVIASSPGSGGSLCFRYCDQYYYGESGELLTRHFPRWVSPKVRFFTGRENKLPADMHYEYALIAPRPVLMSTAINDSVENTWSVEQTYDLVHPVWEFLGAPGNLAVRYRPGPHAPDPAALHADSDFLEAMVAGKRADELFPYQPIHVWNYSNWLTRNHPLQAIDQYPDHPAENDLSLDGGKPIARDAWPARRDEIRHQVAWLLGDGPAYKPIAPDFSAGESDEDAKRLGRPGKDHARLRFGEGINASVYRPDSAKSNHGKLPAVVWLSPLHTSTGYVPGYREGGFTYSLLAKQGYVTLAFDPIATGGRQEERRDFYDRNPHWSLLGKMVLDARHAIDALAAAPEVDASRIYVAGFGVGGMVALFTAAVDDRVAGAVSVAGFTPFRTDTDASPTGGIRRWSELYGWIPRLGAFIGHEQKIPIDFPEILAAAAPRPMLIIAPTLDWHANHADVVKAVEAARGVYKMMGNENGITLDSPVQPCQIDDAMEKTLIEWLHTNSTNR